MKKYVLLDWDGNLARTLDVWVKVYRKLLQKRGFDFSDEEIATCFGMAAQRFKEWGIKDVDDALKEMDELAAKLLPEVELYPDALYVLDAIKQSGKKTALITTSLRSNVASLLDAYHMHEYFDELVAHEDTQEHKPHPEPLEKALKSLGGTLSEAVMIGDSDKDIMAAHNAHIDSILFYPPEHAKFYDLDDLLLLKPTYVVNDFRKILDII